MLKKSLYQLPHFLNCTILLQCDVHKYMVIQYPYLITIVGTYFMLCSSVNHFTLCIVHSRVVQQILRDQMLTQFHATKTTKCSLRFMCALLLLRNIIFYTIQSYSSTHHPYFTSQIKSRFAQGGYLFNKVLWFTLDCYHQGNNFFSS